MADPAWNFRAEDDGYGKPLYDTTDADTWQNALGGTIPPTLVYVLEDAITENGETTQKYVNAIYKSMQWLGASSTEEIAAVVGPLMPSFAPELVVREIDYYKKIWQFDGSFPEEDFATGGKVWFREQTKIGATDYASVTDMSFLANAQKA
jgi:NitT/TauT family transport system substrate-binding protein